jgi:hypothetical protein
VHTPVAGKPPFEHWAGGQESEERAGNDQRGHEHDQGKRMAGHLRFPGRHDPQRAVQEAHVPVGYRAGRCHPRLVRPQQPDRIGLGEHAQQGQYPASGEEHHTGPARGGQQ